MIITDSLYFFVRRRYCELYINYLGGNAQRQFLLCYSCCRNYTMRINDLEWKKEEISWQGGLCPPFEMQIEFRIFCF